MRVLRKERKVSQKELAEYLGISIRGYQFYESEDNEPNIKMLIALADFTASPSTIWWGGQTSGDAPRNTQGKSESGGTHGTCNCDRSGPGGQRGRLAAGPAGYPCDLKEMKPHKMTPAHHTQWFGELVCSNSLRSDQLENAVGLLKEELRRMGSLILSCADEHRVEAGGALAVDRHGFAQAITEKSEAIPSSPWWRRKSQPSPRRGM